MNLKNLESTESQKGEKLSEFGVMTEPKIKYIMVNPCHWQKWCPDCKEWFNIILKPPGTKHAKSIPCYCKVCQKIKNDSRPNSYIPVKIDKRKTAKPILIDKMKDVLINGTFAEFMALPKRHNPYDDNDDWKSKRQKL